MSKIIGWIKGNLLIVISIVLIVLLLPAGWYFSGGWNKSIKERATEAYNSEERNLKSRSSITYSLPAVLEGEESITETRTPNRVVTEFFEQQKIEREAQVAEVVDRGVALNMREHTDLVPGLLPKAESERALRRLGLEMAEQIAGTRDQPERSVYARLLKRLNAGLPVDAEVLSSSLGEFKTREEARFAASNPDGKLTEAQQSQLKQSLISRRLGEYKGRAEGLTFYCATDAIFTPENTPYSHVPSTAPAPSEITEAKAFNWLWDFWVISDVLEAVVAGNTNAASGAMAVPVAPVKRVELIRVSGLAVASEDNQSGGSSSRGGPKGFGGGGFGDPQGGLKPSYTGHTGGEAGSSYDIRTVQLTAVVESKQLPRFFDALGKTNYMTVTDVDLYEVDTWAELDEGYFYGSEHVVRAVIEIETVWLRSWTKDSMPDAVRTALGIPAQEQAVEESDG